MSALIVVARPDAGRAKQNTQQTTEEETVLFHFCVAFPSALLQLAEHLEQVVGENL
ncbi:MAG: hypothetical protein ACOX1P_21190 [Thermoguttaceae bacterium]